MSALADLRRELAERWRVAFASGEARGVEAGASFRADVAARLDDAREEREARIRAEAYAAGRDAGFRAGRRDAPAATCAGGRHQWRACDVVPIRRARD